MFHIKATETDHCIYNIKWEFIQLTTIAVSVKKLSSLTGWSTSHMKENINVAVIVLCQYPHSVHMPKETVCPWWPGCHWYKHNSTSVGTTHLLFHFLSSAPEIHQNYFVEASIAASSLSYHKSKYTHNAALTLPFTYQTRTFAHFPTLLIKQHK